MNRDFSFLNQSIIQLINKSECCNALDIEVGTHFFNSLMHPWTVNAKLTISNDLEWQNSKT